MNAADKVEFERHAVRDGDELTAGSMTVKVLETPGHTSTHLSYVISNGDGTPAVFTGGSLLYGSVGRTDLLGEHLTDELTRQQWHSARRLAEELPERRPCTPAPLRQILLLGRRQRRQRQHHRPGEAAQRRSAGAGRAGLLRQAGRRAHGLPRLLLHMGPRNAAGPDEPDLSPSRRWTRQSSRASRRASGVVDLRDKKAYAGRHLAGTVSVAPNNQFSTYIGWVAPYGSPLTLIGESPEQVAEAQRMLVRIGIERPAGAATGDIDTVAEGVELRSLRRRLPSAAAAGDVRILDVRRHDERRSGASPAPRTSLSTICRTVSTKFAEGEVWVHCAGGYRASIAASILDRAQHPVVHIDDDFSNAEKARFRVQPREIARDRQRLRCRCSGLPEQPCVTVRRRRSAAEELSWNSLGG